jgi:hypothetical protein
MVKVLDAKLGLLKYAIMCIIFICESHTKGGPKRERSRILAFECERCNTANGTC